MSYHYHPDAQREASAALAYYAAISPQLGVSFLTELFERNYNRLSDEIDRSSQPKNLSTQLRKKRAAQTS